MRKIVSLFFLIFITFNIYANNLVPENMAQRVAKNFYYEAVNQFQLIKLQDINITKSYLIKAKEIPAYYVFDINNQGHIYVAAYNNIHPVLGYSLQGNYNANDHSPAYNDFINNFIEQIIYAQTNKTEVSKEIKEEWTKYSNVDFIPSKSIISVGPLLSTTWNQGCYYNEYCPAGTYSCSHVPTGCAATAMAQVMKYNNYPTNGIGTHTYTDPVSCNESSFGLQTADFGNTTYGWSSMPNSLSESNSYVATLMRHCGVSISTDYGNCGSSAAPSAITEALIFHFDYYMSARTLTKYSDITEWQNLLVQELDANRPMVYYGYNIDMSSGHGFVCDGYQNSTYFHFNWGWGGSNDGYFYLDNLTPGGTHNYNYYQGAIVGITPPKMNGPDVVCNGSTNTFSVLPINGATYTWTIPAGFTVSKSITSPSLSENSTSITDGIAPPTPVTPPSINLVAPASGTGYYTITINVTLGTKTQTISKTFRLGAPAQPSVITVTPSGTPYCVGDSRTLSINPVPNASSYNWYFTPAGSGLTLYPNGTSCDIDFNSVGTFTVYVTASNSCGTGPYRSRGFTTHLPTFEGCHPKDDITGINNIEVINNFSIYPNPNNNGVFNIGIADNSFNENKSIITVYDVMGKTIYENTCTNISKEKIDISLMPHGIYFVKIINGDETFTDKLIYQ